MKTNTRLKILITIFFVLLAASVAYFQIININEQRANKKNAYLIELDRKQQQCTMQCKQYYIKPQKGEFRIPLSNFSELHGGCFYTYELEDKSYPNKIYNCENNQPILVYDPNFTVTEIENCTNCTNIFSKFNQQKKG